MTVDFVFSGYSAKYSHVLRHGSSPNSSDSALCGMFPRALNLWLGTGSQTERIFCEALPLCKVCKKIGREGGYDLGEHNLPVPAPFEFTIETEAGEVDLVVVQRILAGIRVEYTPADKLYVIKELLRSVQQNPPVSGGRAPADPRYELAASGLGVGPELVRHWVADRNRVIRRREKRDERDS